MKTIFRHSLPHFRGQILGWGIALGLYGLYMMLFWDTLDAQREQFKGLLDAYPKEMMVFFGDTDKMFEPAGYLNFYMFFFLSIIVGIYALLAGSGLVASDEEKGTLDLLLAHPISRTAFFWGRVLAFVAATAGILIVSWLGLLIGLQSSTMPITWLETGLPYLSMFTLLLFFGAFALLMSMVLPSRSGAAMVSALLLVAGYFITSLARIDKSLQTVEKFSPFHYYQGGEAINGLNVTWLVGMLAVSAIFAILAWWRFQRRDIRVGGEGSWRLPFLRRTIA